MSDFKTKMYQIQFRMGVRPRPCWGSLQHSPDPITGFKGRSSKWSGGAKREWREGRGPLSFFLRIYTHAVLHGAPSGDIQHFHTHLSQLPHESSENYARSPILLHAITTQTDN